MIHPERCVVPELNLVDVEDGLIWGKDGTVTLLYRLDPHHEPGLDDAAFSGLALQAENSWSGVPEGTSWQFLVMVDELRGLKLLQGLMPTISGTGQTGDVLESLRGARLEALTEMGLVQERRHYVAATFAPTLLRSSIVRNACDGARTFARRLVPARWRGGAQSAESSYERAYEQVRREADVFDRRALTLLQMQGLGAVRCGDAEIVGVLHELLSPDTASSNPLHSLSARARREIDGLPRGILEDLPFCGDISPVWSLIDDDWLIRRDYLQLGSRYVSVLSLKALPDRTEPGLLVPLLRLNRSCYRVVYRVDAPGSGAELAALRAKAALADGLRLENLLVRSDRADPHAEAVGKQVGTALRHLIASTQRIFGVSLQIALCEKTPEALDEAVQETLATLSRAHGLRGYRETFNLKGAYLSLLPGAPALLERRRKALTPVMVDMLPSFDFKWGSGKVPFLTPNHSAVLFDPWDTAAQANANVLVTGTSGAGKSVAVQVLLSGYEIACAGRGEERPYTFILDNGQSYRRWCEIKGDSRYVGFSFEEPPGIDPFSWDEQDGPLDEHVSRLEGLLLDLMRVSDVEPEAFERKKGVVEEALYALYREQRFPRDFAGFADALGATPIGQELCRGLYPFTKGTLARLLRPHPALTLNEDVRTACYDFQGLADHRDLAAIALRLVVYQVRRFSARVARRRGRTFLVLDESWALLDSASGGAVARTAAPFIAASVRMGRKEGMSVIGLSQQIDDFAQGAYGAAILGNSATKLIGMPGGDGVEAVRRHLRLTDRQVEQVRGLARTDRYHEFLLLQGDVGSVIRVVLDPLSRWIFTSSPVDRERIDRLAAARPELSAWDRLRLLAADEADPAPGSAS